MAQKKSHKDGMKEMSCKSASMPKGMKKEEHKKEKKHEENKIHKGKK